MKSDFKVLDWLRKVRDQYAQETKGLSDEERLARLHQETGAWVRDLRRKPPNSAPQLHVPAFVHEDKPPYGLGTRHGGEPNA